MFLTKIEKNFSEKSKKISRKNRREFLEKIEKNFFKNRKKFF